MNAQILIMGLRVRYRMYLRRIRRANTHLLSFLHAADVCNAVRRVDREDNHHKSSHQCPHPVNNSYCGTQFGGCSAWRSRFRLVQSDIPRRLMRWQNSVLKLGKQGSADVRFGVSCVGVCLFILGCFVMLDRAFPGVRVDVSL